MSKAAPRARLLGVILSLILPVTLFLFMMMRGLVFAFFLFSLYPRPFVQPFFDVHACIYAWTESRTSLTITACVLFCVAYFLFCFVRRVRVYFCVMFPFILDVKFIGCTSRDHTGGRSHKISHPPSFCGACLYFSREGFSRSFPSST